MKTFRVMGVIAILLLVGGCRITEDTRVGQTTPLQPGEMSPSQEAHSLLDPLSSLPYAGPVVPFLVPLISWIFAWKRGRRIRLSLPTSTNPVTGYWGDRLGVENMIQHLADVVAGAFEVGPENSGIRRGWKVVVASVAAAWLVSLPALHGWMVSHPDATAAAIGTLSAFMLALEKELSKVLPVVSAPPATQLAAS